MSAIQALAPFIGAYQGKIRRAKDASGMTLEELSNESGVSFSAVSRLYAGTQADPRLYNSAALCKTLGLSLDELFGLEKPVGSPNELQERAHRLEVENASLLAENEVRMAQVKAAHTICYTLLFFSSLLAVSLIVYLLIDSQITDAGIIRNGKLSVAAWALVVLIVASVTAAGVAILRIVRKETEALGDALRKM